MKREGILILVVILAGAGLLGYFLVRPVRTSPEPSGPKLIAYHPRQPGDTSGFQVALSSVPEPSDYTSFEEVRQAYSQLGYRGIKKLDADLASGLSPEMEIQVHFTKALLYAYEGDAREVTEFSGEYRKLNWPRVRVPER